MRMSYRSTSKQRRMNRYENMLRDMISEDERKKKEEKKSKPGARAIFLQKYRETGDFEKSKQELINNGFKTENFENKKLDKTSDDTFKEWIEEDR